MTTERGDSRIGGELPRGFLVRQATDQRPHEPKATSLREPVFSRIEPMPTCSIENVIARRADMYDLNTGRARFDDVPGRVKSTNASWGAVMRPDDGTYVEKLDLRRTRCNHLVAGSGVVFERLLHLVNICAW